MFLYIPRYKTRGGGQVILAFKLQNMYKYTREEMIYNKQTPGLLAFSSKENDKELDYLIMHYFIEKLVYK